MENYNFISTNELYSVLVDNPNNARRVEPGFTINLDRNALVIQQFDDFFAFYAEKKRENIWFQYTLSLQMSCTLFLWTIRIIPGGWSQASPSTWTGTPSSPRIRMTIDLHWAILCLCRLTILEAPMCMEPNTATTLNYT